MSTKYLLPCRCGQHVVIEPRQAGETVVCACGESLPVPTMLEVTALEPVPLEAELAASGGDAWGSRQVMVLLGVAMLLLAMGLGVWHYKTRPVAPSDVFDPEMIRQSVEDLPPALTWQNWSYAKKGLDRRTDQWYEAALVRYHVWTTTAIVMAVAGITLIGIGAAKWRSSASRKGSSPRSQ